MVRFVARLTIETGMHTDQRKTRAIMHPPECLRVNPAKRTMASFALHAQLATVDVRVARDALLGSARKGVLLLPGSSRMAGLTVCIPMFTFERKDGRLMVEKQRMAKLGPAVFDVALSAVELRGLRAGRDL